MVIRYSRSALSLQLNWVKLAIICYLLMIRWQLTAVNEQKLQFFCHLQPQSWAKSLTAKTHVTDEFHSLAQIDCNMLAIYQCLEIRLQLFTFSLSPLVGRQATGNHTAKVIDSWSHSNLQSIAEYEKTQCNCWATISFSLVAKTLLSYFYSSVTEPLASSLKSAPLSVHEE